jgi:predicted molibdopterin-dependent oxidoreductase YjgC
MALSPQAVSGAQMVSALAAAAAATGKPRVTLLNLLPRNNMQGCRDMGVMPDLLPGYTQLTDDEGVRRFEGAWGCTLRREAGLDAWQMLDQVAAMYVMGDDPLANAADPKSVREALAKLEFLVVQDLFMSQTAALAHVVLPAAAFAERAGSWTNLERRVQRISPAADPPGDAREDWRIIAGVSSAMGEPLPYEDAAAISAEIAQMLPMYAELSPAQLPLNSGAVWPASDAASGVGAAPARASEVAVAVADPPEKTSEEYPLLLAADPTLRPWDGEATVCNTLAAAVEFTVAEKDYPGGMLLLNPEDAAKAGLRSGQTARVASASGESQMRVRATDEVPAGVALLPYRQAAGSGVVQTAVDSDTGRAVLLPTAVSVGPPK